MVNATTGQPVLRYRHTTPRILASNTKLFTTAAALARYGVAGRLSTEVRGTGTLEEDGTYRGDLYLVGAGDPTFGSSTFARRSYGGGASVQGLAAALERHRRAQGHRAHLRRRVQVRLPARRPRLALRRSRPTWAR